MELGDFIIRAHEAENDEVLFELLKNYVHSFGMDSVIFCLMTDHRSIGEPAKHGRFVGYPEDWMKHYIASNYEPIDPIRKESMLQRQGAFTWEGIDEIRPYNKKERAILNQAKDAGLKDGVAVSLQNIHNEIICMGFASSAGKVELNPVTLSLLKLASIHFYDMYQALKLSSKNTCSDLVRIYLTDREREILQWTAVGKTASEIGDILKISEHTVLFYIRECCTKLETNNKLFAVVKALRLGLIELDTDLKPRIPVLLSDKKTAIAC